MNPYVLTHVNNEAIVRGLMQHADHDRRNTALWLAYIAEGDTRQLYRERGCPSMFAFCVGELRLSEDAAYMRIRAARACRKAPDLFIAIAEGRLHLTAISLIAQYLTPENGVELMNAATHRNKAEIEEWLARRFPLLSARKSAPPVIRVVGVAPVEPNRNQLALGSVPEERDSGPDATIGEGHSASKAAEENIPLSGSESPSPCQLVPEQVGTGLTPCGDSSDVPPNAHDGFGVGSAPPRVHYRVQLDLEESTHRKLRVAQTLLSHSVPDGNVNKVFDRALDALIAAATKRRLGTERARTHPTKRRPKPKPDTSPSNRARYIPAGIRRAVWERDQRQCTFIGTNGQRCGTRHFLEFDHVEPVARGGKATVEGLRLRCRAHNQYEAERVFGGEFMKRKRSETSLARAAARRKRRAERLARIEGGRPAQADVEREASELPTEGQAPHHDNLGGRTPGG